MGSNFLACVNIIYLKTRNGRYTFRYRNHRNAGQRIPEFVVRSRISLVRLHTLVIVAPFLAGDCDGAE
jgi:hypothetical protein